MYQLHYPKIVIKTADGPVVFELPYDEDMEKPGTGLRRTVHIEKRQLNQEGTPELVFRWESCINNNLCYKGVKVVDIDKFECLLDQVTFKSIEIPADTANNADAKAKRVEYKRNVKFTPGEIVLEDVTEIKPDDIEDDDKDELMATPTGSYKIASKNKFLWNKLAEPATTSRSLASKKQGKQGKKEEL